MNNIKILVACEESQRVAMEFVKRGFEAYSCDIIDCSGGHPEIHIKQDVIPLLKGGKFFTCDSKEHYVKKWTCLICFPPCTFLTVTGNRWFNVEKYGEKALKRIQDREEAKVFFYDFC